jgi:hypothetical protein
MVHRINSVTTKTAGWQQQCWEWAEASLSFELRDVEAGHFAFCQELCAEYGYTYRYNGRRGYSVVQFKPKAHSGLGTG